MNFGFVIDNRKCIGCHACTVACKSEHDVPVGVYRTWVKYVEKGVYPNTRRTFAVHRCNHCAKAPCAQICPVSALHTRSDGIVDFNRERCVGCKACTQACPYNALYIDPATHTIAKCNYCAHRIDIGLEPACVNVCPEHAIVSGNIEDKSSEISHLIARKQIQVRKPEKGTLPKLFYIESDEASITPTAAAPADSYLWSAQARGVGHHNGKQFPISNLQSLNSDSPWISNTRRVYDAPDKGVMWGWGVAGYIWTKAVSAGAVIMAFLASSFGVADVQIAGIILSLAFLILTGIILAVDLDRPDRFLYVLLRPNWKSWLVKGAYIISIYGGLLTLYLFMKFLNPLPFLLSPEGRGGVRGVLSLLIFVFAVLSAVYTAFLFAQAKGRDFWQSPFLPLYMFIHSLIGGAALWLIVTLFIPVSEPFIEFTKAVLSGAIIIHLLLETVEAVLPHPTKDSQMAGKIKYSGALKYLFWGGAVFAGNILPLILLSVQATAFMPLSAVLILIGIYISNHIIVRAPQMVPLS